MDLVVSVSLGSEVVDRVLGGREEEVAGPVGDDAVDLFGHRPVAAAEPGFDVGDEGSRLGADEGAGHGSVDVAGDGDHVGTEAFDEGLEGDHDGGRLPGVGAASRLEVVVGFADPEFVEEHVAHERVVVLAGVHQDGLGGVVVEGGEDGSDLHEVGPCAGHEHDPHRRDGSAPMGAGY